jgi:NADPH:quinone reductase-like Zn-dependent oxidoreductase
MIAVQINSFGGYEVLTINNNAPKPLPSSNQVLVEVYAASLNPVDKGIAAGYLKDMVHIPATLSLILRKGTRYTVRQLF